MCDVDPVKVINEKLASVSCRLQERSCVRHEQDLSPSYPSFSSSYSDSLSKYSVESDAIQPSVSASGSEVAISQLLVEPERRWTTAH